MKLVWIHDSNSNSIYDYLNALYLFCPKQRTNIVQTCMKMVQMDRLDFSDHFSYINYFIWSYGWISMNFRSFRHFLEFSELNYFLIYFNSRKELLRQHDLILTSSGQQGGSRSNLTCGGYTSVSQGCLAHWQVGPSQRPRQLGQSWRVGPRWLG